MNELLAQIYGTAQEEEEVLEKTAEELLLEELEKVAAAEGIDLDELSDEDILEILQDAINDEPEEEKTASAEVDDEDLEMTDDDQEKLAEADFMGRMMAHAFYQELNDIGDELEKEAAKAGPGVSMDTKAAKAFEEQARKERAAGRKTKIGPGREVTGGGTYARNRAPSWGTRAMERLHGGEATQAMSKKQMAGMKARATYEQLKKALGSKWGKRGLIGGGLLAAGGLGALLARKGKEKKSFDEQAVERAEDILGAAAGVLEYYDDQEYYEQEKTSADEELDLNARALEILDAEGYDVDTIVDLLSDE